MSSIKNDFLAQSQKLKDIHTESLNTTLTNNQPTTASSNSSGFFNQLLESLEEINKEQKTVNKMSTDLATNKSENIHETMVAMSHSEMNFKFMVQVRNKALEAYQEIMRMPV